MLRTSQHAMQQSIRKCCFYLPNATEKHGGISIQTHRQFTSKPSSIVEPQSQADSQSKSSKESKSPEPSSNIIPQDLKLKPKYKTVAQADAELLAKLEGISGEGGAAGVEYEGGKAVGLKRGVKDNMFRVI